MLIYFDDLDNRDDLILDTSLQTFSNLGDVTNNTTPKFIATVNKYNIIITILYVYINLLSQASEQLHPSFFKFLVNEYKQYKFLQGL